MSTQSQLPVPGRALIVWSALGWPRNFSIDDAEAVVNRLTPGDEAHVARQLQAIFPEYRRKPKYAICLQIAARLAGRESIFDGQPKPVFKTAFLGFGRRMDGEKTFSDFSKLADAVSVGIRDLVFAKRSPFVARVANHQLGMVFDFPTGNNTTARVVVSLLDDGGYQTWLDAIPTLVERVRRLVEEGAVRGFLDGYHCAHRSKAMKGHAGRLSVHHLGMEIIHGSELAAFAAMEKSDEGMSFDDAHAAINAVHCGNKIFRISYFHVQASSSGSMQVNTSTLLEPQTEHLLARYIKFKRWVKETPQEKWWLTAKDSSDPTFSFEVRQFSTRNEPVISAEFAARMKRLLILNDMPSVGARERAMLRRQCSAEFGQAFSLGYPEPREDDKRCIKKLGAGVDHAACKIGWGRHVNTGRPIVDFRRNDHAVFYFERLPLTNGNYVEYCTAMVSMPYIDSPESESKSDRARAVTDAIGWTYVEHKEWSWHMSGSTTLVIFQRSTPHDEMLRLWKTSFKRWLVENRARLTKGASADRRLVVLDAIDCRHFPLDVQSYDDCRERYLKEYVPHLYEDEDDTRAKAFRFLFEKWQAEINLDGGAITSA